MRSANLILICAVFLSGCSSIRTEMWSRDQNDNFYSDAQVQPGAEKHLNGVPVMLKVPTHLEVVITETMYARYDETGERLNWIKLDRPDLHVSRDLKYTEKMFLVNPRRVAAGSGEYGFGFEDSGVKTKNANGELNNGHGYLHSADYKAVDDTIRRSAELLATILNLPNAQDTTSAADLDGGAAELIKVERVVAYRRFDLAEPCVDEQVLGFLDKYMNCCHLCDNSVPAVKVDNAGTVNVQDVYLELTPAK